MPAPGSQTPPDPWSERQPAYRAAAHRHRLLQRTRAISLGIAGGAAVAALGLGTAFAHAIPGHSRPSGAQNAPAAPAQPSSPAPPASSAPSSTQSPDQSPTPARTHRIAPPPQPPASTPAPPQVSSGGS